MNSLPQTSCSQLQSTDEAQLRILKNQEIYMKLDRKFPVLMGNTIAWDSFHIYGEIIYSSLYEILTNLSAKGLISDGTIFYDLGSGIGKAVLAAALILNFSKLLNQKASHIPSGQHALNEEYYERIEAIQFTIAHDDGNLVEDINKADVILLGVSRTSKTPTSIYLANKGFKTLNIPLVNENSIPENLKKNPKLSCVVGLTTEPERLADIRKNRMNTLRETENTNSTNIKKIEKEIADAKKTYIKYKWPTIDVTRKSVVETAASIIKIHEIYKTNDK